MKYGLQPVFGAVALCVATIIAATASAPITAQQQPPVAVHPSTPAADPAALFENTCAGCHELEQATATPMDLDGWRATVERMIGYGAKLSPEQADAVVRYLAEHHGPAAAQVH